MDTRTQFDRHSVFAVRLKAFVAATVIAVASFAIACGGSSSTDAGAEAPDFSLPVANGAGKITLSDYRGDKNVVLVFYRGYF